MSYEQHKFKARICLHTAYFVRIVYGSFLNDGKTETHTGEIGIYNVVGIVQ